MCFIKKIILAIITLISVLASEVNIAYARWANYNDSEIKIEHSIQNLYINKDGKSSNTYEIRAKILKENGKTIWSNYSYPYNSNTNSVEILEAYTLLNHKKYNVNPSQIIKQSMPASLENLDKQTQIIIPYSKLKIGSIVFLKARITDLKSQLSHFYSTHFTFGHPFYTNSASVYVTSELPLYLSINDPEKRLNIKQSIKKIKHKTLYCIEIHQKKPIYKNIIAEDKIHFNLKDIPLVGIAAMPTKSHYAKTAAIEYTKIKNQALPLLYKEIADIAKSKPTAIDQINTVTSLLAENIVYLVNPATLKGNFFPQSLQEVADTRRGDCKDFSMATCVILEAIGLSSKIAFIRNGEMALPFPSDLPGQGINHAIVKVELPAGPLWIDPTHPISMANHIFANIANRKALVLHKDNATYENIPSIKPEDYRFIKYESWDIKNPSQTHIKGNLQLLGGSAWAFTGRKNTLSEQAIEHMFLSSITGHHNQILHYDISLPELKSRIVKDLFFEYTMTVKKPILKTKTGNAISFPFNGTNLFMAHKNDVSAIHLGPPRIYESYITIQNISSLELKDLYFFLESPWVNLSRKLNYDNDKHPVLIHQKMEVKKSWIEDTDLKSDTYKKLQSDIFKNFSKSILIFTDIQRK